VLQVVVVAGVEAVSRCASPTICSTASMRHGRHVDGAHTGYTCTAVARLVASGAFRRPGICPPEYVGQAPGCADAVLADLAARGVNFTVTVDA
jgi:saccharopine dehydrogenase-like NADP-dependent oxidoreductase